MFTFLSESEIASEFSKLEGEGEKRIAVAFWGDGALPALGLGGAESKNAKIICNLESGATNPAVIEGLIKAGAIVKSNPRLHSKVYLAGNTVILGSSNASGNGLALEGKELTGWIEANVLTNDESFVADVSQWFSEQWEIAINVKNTDIEQAKKLWLKRRQSRPYDSKDTSFFDLPLESLRDRQIFIAMYREDASSEATHAFNKVKDDVAKQAKRPSSKLSDLSFFEAWDDLPRDASIISIYVGPRGGVRMDSSVYRRIPSLDQAFIIGNEESKIQVVISEKQILDKPFDEETRNELHKRIAPEISRFQESRKNSYCINLFDALPKS